MRLFAFEILKRAEMGRKKKMIIIHGIVDYNSKFQPNGNLVHALLHTYARCPLLRTQYID